jgi:sRNA-binding regulator protein Hfq
MADSSAIPVRRVDSARQETAKSNSSAKPVESPALPSISPAGPRKLIRPQLPADARFPARSASGISSTRTRPEASSMRGQSSHAEAYYLQKQIQSRTLMVFLLEDGERIEGTIEWYDLHAIKVRHGALRTLIYKDGIKYLYKAGESNPLNGRL